ncbi:MAG TPA: hypothetical protein VHW73_12335 [Rudaea sp.]|jgi:hypothetical protein|nr:hypothetical protein [Rudaea sp.]
MKSFKMKALAVAVLGLAGMGSVMAATCPSIAAGNVTGGGAGGGAWFGQSQGGGGTLSIVNPGLHGTTCALNVAISAAPVANLKGQVIDNSPQSESRYRARFYFDSSALALPLANVQATIFDAFANTAPGTQGTDEVQIFLAGGAAPALHFVVADSGKSTGVQNISYTLPTSANGHYYVEFDLTKGAGSSSTVACNGGDAGCFRYWVVAEGGTAPTDPSPSGTYSASNAGWSGIVQAQLGLYGTTANFRADNASKNFAVDEFDSRRQTFIGF